jgi:hypothetical protein
MDAVKCASSTRERRLAELKGKRTLEKELAPFIIKDVQLLRYGFQRGLASVAGTGNVSTTAAIKKGKNELHLGEDGLLYRRTDGSNDFTKLPLAPQHVTELVKPISTGELPDGFNESDLVTLLKLRSYPAKVSTENYWALKVTSEVPRLRTAGVEIKRRRRPMLAVLRKESGEIGLDKHWNVFYRRSPKEKAQLIFTNDELHNVLRATVSEVDI